MGKEIINVLTDDTQKETERGKDAQQNAAGGWTRQRCAQKLNNVLT